MGSKLPSSPFFLALLLLSWSPFWAQGLFEDQAFKFDWRKILVGKPKGGRLWENSQGESALVVFSEGVLAALDSDSGEVRWRHIMEEGERIMSVSVSERTVATVSYLASSSGLKGSSASEDEEEVVPYYRIALRLWSPSNGALNSEMLSSIPAEKGDEDGSKGPEDASFILGTEANIITFEEKTGVLTVRAFDLKKSSIGEELGSSRLVLPPGLRRPECANTRSALLCLDRERNTLYHAALPLTASSSSSKPAFAAVSLSSLGLPKGAAPVALASVHGARNLASVAFVGVDRSEEVLLITTEEGGLKAANVVKSSPEKGRSGPVVSMLTGCKNTDATLHLQQACSDDQCYSFESAFRITHMTAAPSSTSSFSSSSSSTEVRLPFPVSKLESAWSVCDDDGAFRLFLLTSDGTLAAADSSSPSPPSLLWHRDESLSAITAVDMLDTAADDDDGTYDEEGSAAERNEALDVLDQFVKRVRHHGNLLNHAITRVVESRDLQKLLIGEPDSSYDDFGLRKIVVAVAAGLGKVVGIDSKTGKVIWRLNYPGGGGEDQVETKLFVQRGTAHFGYDARCTLVYRNVHSGRAELLSFNPTDGATAGPSRQLEEGFTQAVMMHHVIDDHIKPILLLHGSSGKVTTEPESASSKLPKAVIDKTYLVTMEKATGTIRGQKLVSRSPESGSLAAVDTWSLSNPSAEVVLVAGKDSEERVHSQGRVMADRSVLFKYVNPNLALVLAEGRDASGKTFLNVYLADMVTGRVVFSANHKRVSGPYRAVHSENWAVYTYYNEKSRRGEITSIELFEGSVQSNSTVFSSLSPSTPLSPLVERQSFILGGNLAHVSALGDTVTEKAITSKTLLLATPAGAVFAVPRVLLDPRRPNFNTPPEKREPGLPPYVPELVLPQEMVLNYNQSIGAPRGVATAATGLESTSVAFVYGLDIYCTRISPSKGFDLLKEDFDYYVISLVLGALVLVAYVTRKLGQRKSLKQAWR